MLQEIASQKTTLQVTTEQEIQRINARKDASLAALDQLGQAQTQAALQEAKALCEQAKAKLRPLIRPLAQKLLQAKAQIQAIIDAEKQKIKQLESSNPTWANALRASHNFEGHEQWQLNYAFRFVEEINKL